MNITPIRPHPNLKDAEQVEVLTAFGASTAYITAHLQITEANLNKHYSPQLIKGLEEANLKVAKRFFEMASSDAFPQMTVAWMKMRAGWRDNTTSAPADLDNTELDTAKEKLLTLLNRGK